MVLVITPGNIPNQTGPLIKTGQDRMRHRIRGRMHIPKHGDPAMTKFLSKMFAPPAGRPCVQLRPDTGASTHSLNGRTSWVGQVGSRITRGVGVVERGVPVCHISLWLSSAAEKAPCRPVIVLPAVVVGLTERLPIRHRTALPSHRQQAALLCSADEGRSRPRSPAFKPGTVPPPFSPSIHLHRPPDPASRRSAEKQSLHTE